MMQITSAELLDVLSRHIGATRGVHIDALVAEIWPVLAGADHPAAARKVRELIVALRLEGHHICAHPSTGYYVAETAEELDRTCLFLYDRAMSSLEQIAAMKRISLPDLRGQLRLPT